MRKSINLLVGVFLFVLVFSFSCFKTLANDSINFNMTDGGITSLSSDSVDLDASFGPSRTYQYYYALQKMQVGSVDLSAYYDLDDNQLYSIDLSFYASVVSSVGSYTYPTTFNMICGSSVYRLFEPNNTDGTGAPLNLSSSSTLFFYGKDSNLVFEFMASLFSETIEYQSVSVDLNVTFDNLQNVSTSDTSSYEAGYNAGYSVGLEEGTNAGYSSGYSAGYSQGTNSGYNSGFQAGVNSVDTQSYYDAGYQAGQASGYSTGYEDGYDSGYQEAMSRIDSWGADKTDYPLLVKDIHLSDGYISFSTLIDNYAYYEDTDGGGFYRYSYSGEYIGSNGFFDNPDFEINPNHIYAIELSDFYTSLNGSGVVYLNMGSSEFCFSERDEVFKTNIKLFANGSEIGNNITFRVNGICQTNSLSKTQYIYFNNFRIYDYGPVGDTQNHIANQTNDLTNGYDSSSGESASNTFANDASSYEQAESNIFTSAKNDLNNFQFYDIGSNSSVLVGLSFVSSSMTAIFGAMGGMTGGAGIVLSVLFSVMLVSIVIGTYRYFVSSGKTGKSSSMKGGKG